MGQNQKEQSKRWDAADRETSSNQSVEDLNS